MEDNNNEEKLINEIKELKELVIPNSKSKIKALRKTLWSKDIKVCSCGNNLRRFTSKRGNIHWVCDDCFNAYNPDGTFDKYHTPWKGSQDDFAYHESDDEDYEEGINV
jgi:hypothetical protein